MNGRAHGANAYTAYVRRLRRRSRLACEPWVYVCVGRSESFDTLSRHFCVVFTFPHGRLVRCSTWILSFMFSFWLLSSLRFHYSHGSTYVATSHRLNRIRKTQVLALNTHHRANAEPSPVNSICLSCRFFPRFLTFSLSLSHSRPLPTHSHTKIDLRSRLHKLYSLIYLIRSCECGKFGCGSVTGAAAPYDVNGPVRFVAVLGKYIPCRTEKSI